MHSNKNSRSKGYAVELSRLVIALTLLFSGFVKGVDPVGGAIKFSEYFTAFGLGFLEPLSTVASVVLSSIEFFIGGFLLMGLWRKWSSLAAFLLMLFMTGLTLYLALFNPVSDCFCFGDAVKMTNWQTFLKNIVLLPLSALLFAWHGYMSPSWKIHRLPWLLPCAILVGWVLFIGGNLLHLPMIDFRPFKVGASIPSLVLPPPDAPQPVIEYQFIYEQNGVRDTFDMHSLPAEGENWVYIDRIENVISKGYTPPVEDFSIFRGEQEVTSDLLEVQTPMIWVLSPNWTDASCSAARRINRLYNWAHENNIRFYGISSSIQEEQEQWRSRSGASYPLLFMDAVTIKTIARANPSILFIKSGVILNKINADDLPGEDIVPTYASRQIDKPIVSKLYPEVHVERWIILFLWATSTLVLLILNIGKGERVQPKGREHQNK